jgi:hypothetical protein
MHVLRAQKLPTAKIVSMILNALIAEMDFIRIQVFVKFAQWDVSIVSIV